MEIYKNTYYNTTFIYIFKINIIALFVALTTIFRYLLMFIPNVELVTFILLLSVLVFSVDVGFSIINCSCFIQVLLFGIPDLAYFYIFNLYGIIVFILRGIILKHWWIFPILVFIFGLTFGFLYALEQWVLFGFNAALAYWIAGIIFDIIHAVGNCFFCIVCYIPLFNFFKVMAEHKSFLFNRYFIKDI